MSKNNAQMLTTIRADPPRIVVADSKLEWKIEFIDKVLTEGKEFVSDKIKLMELSDASWTVTIKQIDAGSFYFFADFHEFPEELKNKSKAHFFVSCGGEVVSQLFSGSVSALQIHHQCSKTSLTKHFVDNSLTLKFWLVVTCEEDLDLRHKFFDPQTARDSIVKTVSSMFGDPTFSDFTFIVGDREFKVHMGILAAASPVMSKMFTSNLEEAKTKKCAIKVISPEIFEHLLRFIYRGEIPEDLKTIAKPLYEAAHYYEIEHLKRVCRREIQESLTLANALEIFEWVQLFDELEQLKLDAWTIVKRDILKIFVELKHEPLSLERTFSIIKQRQQENRFWRDLEDEAVEKAAKIPKLD